MMGKNTICAIDGCGKNVQARGYCAVHYSRWRKHGDAETILRVPAGEPLKWILRNSGHLSQGCLIWPFYRENGGYGQTVYNGKKSKASRVMCILAHGNPPSPFHVAAHTCGMGHTGCVNPTHLRWATVVENCQDSIDHGTSTRGSKNARCKLTDDQVIEIRKLCEKKTSAQTVIAKMFGVSQATVSAIHMRKNWGWKPSQ